MPILHVRALPQADSLRIQPALKAACLAIAQAYDCDPQQVWATWEEIASGRYVEGLQAAQTQPIATHPPIAELICFEGKSPEKIEQVLLAAGKALAEGLGIPGNVFITYQEALSGRVLAGDGVIRRR